MACYIYAGSRAKNGVSEVQGGERNEHLGRGKASSVKTYRKYIDKKEYGSLKQ